jgi:hypothetical protein
VISVSAVNTGRVPVTLRMANARILGDRQFATREWMHQEPRPLAVLVGTGERWEGLIDANAFAY